MFEEAKSNVGAGRVADLQIEIMTGKCIFRVID